MNYEDKLPFDQVQVTEQAAEPGTAGLDRMEAAARLAGGIAHDFNNLLTAISGYAELMLRNLDETDLNWRAAHSIKRASDAAHLLTTQLLAFSKRQVFRTGLLDLRSVVQQSAEALEALCGKGVTLELELEDSEVVVEVDASQIQQAIINLGVNARDAMKKKGVLGIRCHKETVEKKLSGVLGSIDPGEYAVLTVSDSGCGIPESIRAYIFEPFFTANKKNGTGLGLSTVYGVISQHRGNIVLETSPGSGTTFRVYLKSADAPVEVEIPSICSRETKTKTQQVLPGTETVLVVDDESVVRCMMRDTLELNGYKVIEASRGGEALQALARYDSEIQLLLTDLTMPEMTGIELARRVKEIRPGIRVLVVTGASEGDTDFEELTELGFRIVRKPFSTDTFVSSVRETLDGTY